jgi:hypothetical protein
VNRNWDYWINSVDESDGLSPNEKQKAKAAFHVIRDLFGEDLQASVIAPKHPIYDLLWNRAGWTRRWLINFSEAVESCIAQKNSVELMTKLKDPKMYKEGLLHLDIAKRFVDSGFLVEFLKEDRINKVPDLKIVNPFTGEEIFVELTEMGQSIQSKDSSETFREISMKLLSIMAREEGPRLIHKGIIHKPHLSKPSREKILKDIDEIAEKAGKTGFEEMIEEGVIELAIAREDNSRSLEEWAQKRKMDRQSSLSMPLFFPDETYRLSTKIREKFLQLKKGNTNILIIRANTFFFRAHNIDDAISRVEEFVFENKDLLLCVIIGGYMGGEEQDKIRSKGNHLYLVRSDGLITREVMILSNKFFKGGPVGDDSYSKVKHALIAGTTLIH